MTHCFVFRFDSAEDRDYYLNKDPAHLSFVKDTADIVEMAQVVDFTPGQF